jgi:hypothetical protein
MPLTVRLPNNSVISIDTTWALLCQPVRFFGRVNGQFRSLQLVARRNHDGRTIVCGTRDGKGFGEILDAGSNDTEFESVVRRVAQRINLDDAHVRSFLELAGCKEAIESSATNDSTN